MKRFKFNLESVLMVRKKTLTDEQTKLASILNLYNKQVDILNKMMQQISVLESENENLLQGENYNPVIISNYSMYSKKMLNDIKLQKEIIKTTKKDIENQQQNVKIAYIKVKSLENLEEKQKERYFKELQREEIKEIDDIVNSRRSIA